VKENPKSEIPSTNIQIPEKHHARMTVWLEICILDIGSFLEVGSWNLEFLGPSTFNLQPSTFH
jgi:hypothetical protein